MVGLKAVVFLAVLSFATACVPIHGKPKTECSCHKKNPIILPRPGLPIIGPIQKPKHDGSSWIYLGRLLLGIGDKVKECKSILNNIIHLDVAATLDDVLNVVISLSRALGLIIDILIPGLGGLFGRLVIAIVRIVICIVGNAGSPSLLGALLGGKRSPNQAICGPDYGCIWGWKRYDGKWDSHRNLIRHYDLEHARAEFDLIFNNYSKGRGGLDLDLVAKLLYDNILILINLTVKSSWCKDDLITVYISVTTITSLVANSCKPDLGLHIVDELETFCYTHFKNNGYKDIKIYNSDIKKKIERVQCWRWKGVIISDEAKKSSISETSNYDDDESRRSSRTGEDRSNDSESKLTKSNQSSDSNSNDSETRIDRASRTSSDDDQSAQSRRTNTQSTNLNQSNDSNTAAPICSSNTSSSQDKSDISENSKSQNTNSNQSSDSNSNDSQTRIGRQSKTSSDNDQSAQSTSTNTESSHLNQSENSNSQNTNSNQSSGSNSDASQTRTDASSSDDLQQSKNDSNSVDAGKSGRRITEEVSGSSKENKESSSKQSDDASNLEYDQKKIDLKNGVITDTRVVQSKSESVKEQKSASNSEKEFSAKRTIEENC